MSQSILPSFITQYFWGDNLNELDLEKHKVYITQTLLDRGDQQAIRWLFSQVDITAIKDMLGTLRLSKKSDHFWHTYLS